VRANSVDSRTRRIDEGTGAVPEFSDDLLRFFRSDYDVCRFPHKLHFDCVIDDWSRFSSRTSADFGGASVDHVVKVVCFELHSRYDKLFSERVVEGDREKRERLNS